MKHVEACISARKHRESSFHHCGGSVKFVQAWLSARIHRESSFNHRGEHVMHVETCISASKDRQKQFSPRWGFCEAPAGLFKCGKGLRL